MSDLTASVPYDRCCTRLHRSIRSSPNGSSSNCSFPSDSHATHHQVCTCSTHLSSCHHCVDTQSQNCALSKRSSRHRRGSTRSSHESTCCHRDHPSRRQSTCRDSHTCPVRGVSWSEVATVPKRKSHRGLDLDLSLNSEVNIRKGWKKNGGTK